VVDIQIDHIRWHVLIPESLRNSINFRIGVVGVTTLLKSQSPFRWHLHGSRQPGVAADNLCYGRLMDEIIVHITVFGTEVDKTIVGSTKVENSLVSIVKEYSVGASVVLPDIEKNTDIQRVIVDSIAEVVRVPISVGPPKSVEGAGF